MTTTPSTTPSTISGSHDDTVPSASDKAHEAASQATDESKKVASTAAEEAKSVATEATGKARDLIDEAVDQVTEHSRSQLDNLSGVLQSLGDDLRQMSDRQGSGVAADAVRQAADRAHAISSRLDGRGPSELIDDLRQFARQRPALFLSGALVAGALIGRFARGVKGDDSSTGGTEPVKTTSPPALPVSTAGVELPAADDTSAYMDDSSGLGDTPINSAESSPVGERQVP